YDTPTGTYLRDYDKNGFVEMKGDQRDFEMYDLYPVTMLPGQSRAESLFEEMVRNAPPTDGSKKYLLAISEPDAVPPVIQLGRRNDQGKTEVVKVVFDKPSAYEDFLKIIYKYSRDDIWRILGEKTSPNNKLPNADDVQFPHF